MKNHMHIAIWIMIGSSVSYDFYEKVVEYLRLSRVYNEGKAAGLLLDSCDLDVSTYLVAGSIIFLISVATLLYVKRQKTNQFSMIFFKAFAVLFLVKFATFSWFYFFAPRICFRS